MKAISIVLVLFPFFFTAPTWAKVTPVSVTQFKDKTGSSSCRHNWIWWSAYLGDGFKDMLITELSKSDKLMVLERETIRDIYEDEHNLVNSENDGSLEKGQFKKARYTFVGAVTEFEYCAQKKKTSVNIGAVAGLFGVSTPDINVGFGGSKAKVTVDLRVVDTKTGRVVRSIKSTETVEDSKYELDTELGSHEQEKNSPADKAARLAIEKAANEALKVL